MTPETAVSISATLAGIFKSQAERHPSAHAIEDDVGWITYEQLDASTEVLAKRIQEAVPTGGRVGVFGKNSIPWVEVYIAAHKAGVSVVPINYRYGCREVAHIVSGSRISVIFHDPSMSDALHETCVNEGTQLIGLQRESYESHRACATEPLLPRKATEDTVVYTSGTTALPKGARWTDMNQVIGTLFYYLMLFDLGRSDRYLIATPLAHRVAVSKLLCGLLTGGKVYVLGEYEPVTLAKQLVEREITVIGMVPTIARDLVSAYKERQLQPALTLKHIHVTGEALAPAITEELMKIAPNAEISTFYGSSEAGLVTYLDHDHRLVKWGSCGQLLPGVAATVVDEQDNPVKLGCVGELLVRSGMPGTSQVSAGYVDESEIFTDKHGWFHTGDMVRVDNEGYYYVVDRKKDTIRSGGLNISSREVEDIIATHPDVAQIAITGEPDARFGQKVIAWIVRVPGTTVSADDIRTLVKSQAASYKKPSEVRFVPAIPRTASGKLAKRLLRESPETYMSK